VPWGRNTLPGRGSDSTAANSSVNVSMGRHPGSVLGRCQPTGQGPPPVAPTRDAIARCAHGIASGPGHRGASVPRRKACRFHPAVSAPQYR
jgi:hypothetical protein